MAIRPYTQRFDLPGHPGQWLLIDRRLGAKGFQEIDSATNPSVPNGVTPDGRTQYETRYDLRAGALESVVQGLLNEASDWSCRDEDGRALLRTRPNIQGNRKYALGIVAMSLAVYAFIMMPEEEPGEEGEGDASVETPADEGSSSASTGKKGRQGR